LNTLLKRLAFQIIVQDKEEQWENSKLSRT